MAFRNRRSWGRSRRRGKIPFRALPRSVAKKRSQWLTVYNDADNCQFTCLDMTGCQDQPFSIGIVPNASLQALFGDNVAIRRMVGEAFFRPWLPHPDRCNATEFQDWILALERTMVTMRAGLYKQRVAASAPEGVEYNPLDQFDWSEGRALREWRHTWTSRGRDAWATAAPGGAAMGICADVTRAQYTTPATSSGSQPLFIVPEIETSCQIYHTDPEVDECEILSHSIRARQMPWWRMPITSNRRIPLKESDELSIWANLAYIGPDLSSPTTTCGGDPTCTVDGSLDIPCKLNAYLNLKILVEYG